MLEQPSSMPCLGNALGCQYLHANGHLGKRDGDYLQECPVRIGPISKRPHDEVLHIWDTDGMSIVYLYPSSSLQNHQ